MINTGADVWSKKKKKRGTYRGFKSKHSGKKGRR